MSLINQMLRDLEQRRKTAGSPVSVNEGHAVFPTKDISPRTISLVIAGVVLIGVIWAVLTLFPQQHQGTPQALPVMTVKEPVTVAEPVVPPDETVAVKIAETNPSAVAEETTESAIMPSAADPVLLKVALLEEDRSARLLFEFEKHPEYNWKLLGEKQDQLEILFQKTSRSESLELPVFTGLLLEGLAVEAVENGLLLKVEMSPGTKVKVFDLPADAFFGERMLFEFSVPAPIQVKEQAVAPLEVEPKELPEKVQLNSETKKMTKKNLPLSSAERAVQVYQNGLRAMQRNNIPEAEKHFSAALELQPQQLDARLQMVTLLQQQQRTAEATKLLEDGLQLSPANPLLRKVYARYLLEDSQLEKAIAVLLSSPLPRLADDLEYHALLAVLQQELGQHQSAIETYQGLLQLRPQESLWWLGLAISFDQSGETEQAKRAYQRAISLPGLRADLLNYIQSRLQVM